MYERFYYALKRLIQEYPKPKRDGIIERAEICQLHVHVLGYFSKNRICSEGFKVTLSVIEKFMKRPMDHWVNFE